MEGLVIREIEPGEVDAVVETALAAWEPIFQSSRKIMGDHLFGLL